MHALKKRERCLEIFLKSYVNHFFYFLNFVFSFSLCSQSFTCYTYFVNVNVCVLLIWLLTRITKKKNSKLKYSVFSLLFHTKMFGNVRIARHTSNIRCSREGGIISGWTIQRRPRSTTDMLSEGWWVNDVYTIYLRRFYVQKHTNFVLLFHMESEEFQIISNTYPNLPLEAFFCWPFSPLSAFLAFIYLKLNIFLKSESTLGLLHNWKVRSVFSLCQMYRST